MASKHVVRVFRVKMSENLSSQLDNLIDEGAYVTYADAIRHSLVLLQKENESNNSD